MHVVLIPWIGGRGGSTFDDDDDDDNKLRAMVDMSYRLSKKGQVRVRVRGVGNGTRRELATCVVHRDILSVPTSDGIERDRR
jgi:hypothetical protein